MEIDSNFTDSDDDIKRDPNQTSLLGSNKDVQIKTPAPRAPKALFEKAEDITDSEEDEPPELNDLAMEAASSSEEENDDLERAEE